MLRSLRISHVGNKEMGSAPRSLQAKKEQVAATGSTKGALRK